MLPPKRPCLSRRISNNQCSSKEQKPSQFPFRSSLSRILTEQRGGPGIANSSSQESVYMLYFSSIMSSSFSLLFFLSLSKYGGGRVWSGRLTQGPLRFSGAALRPNLYKECTSGDRPGQPIMHGHEPGAGCSLGLQVVSFILLLYFLLKE